ncbi:MAG TPA: VOC family protein [Chitinophagaceae bacterium]|nr:VOC family protein [Chitinophagaceae bacterium]
MSKFSYIPEGYNAVMPALAIRSAEKAIEWYKDVFQAEEKMALKDQSGTIVHAELVIGDTVVMLAEENPQYNRSPLSLGGNTINLFLYTADVDDLVRRAVEKGAKIRMQIEDQFYGDRSGRIEDPFGYIWVVSTHIKDVSKDEMKKVMEDMLLSEK